MLHILILLMILGIFTGKASESGGNDPVMTGVKDETFSQQVFDLVKVIAKYGTEERKVEINEAINKLVELPKEAFEGIDPIKFNEKLFDFHNEQDLDRKIGRIEKIFANLYHSQIHIPDYVVVFLWKLFEPFINVMTNSQNIRMILFFFIENSPALLENSETEDAIGWYRRVIVDENNFEILVKTENYNSFYKMVKSLNVHPYEFQNFLKQVGSWEMESMCKSRLFSEGNREKFEGDGLKFFYDSFITKCDQIFLSNINSETPTQEISAKVNSVLPEMYKEHLRTFSQMIFSDFPKDINEIKQQNKYHRSSYDVAKIIFNNDAYTVNDSGQTDIPIYMTRGMEKGAPLILEEYEYPKGNINKFKTIPIGYNIYVPKGDIQGVVVQVYGGASKDYRKDLFYRPDVKLSNELSYLIEEGIVVIQLNLIDLITVGDFQIMSEEKHAMLHASINKFYEVLIGNNSREILNGFEIPEVAKKKVYLYGASFGGRTAIRHAELFPGTFNGYISHDGWISLEMGILSDIGPLQERGKSLVAIEARKWLDPIKGILSIQEPILLLHNFDDNNVNVKQSLYFYYQAFDLGKGDLIQLYITRRGNPIPSGKKDVLDIMSKGHRITEDEEAFKSYAETIASFILKGPSQFPEMSKWMAHQYEIYANKNYRSATLEERFISEAYRLYKTSKVVDFEKFWNETGRSLYYMLAYLDSLGSRNIEKFKNDINAGLNEDIALQREKELKAPIEAEIGIFKNERVLSDEVVKNAILSQLTGFLEYVREYSGYKLPYDMDLSLFVNNKDMKRIFWEFLVGERLYLFDNADIKLYLLQTLYIGNPDLVTMRIRQLLGEKIPEAFHSDAEEAKQNLRERIDMDRELEQQVLKKIQEKKVSLSL